MEASEVNVPRPALITLSNSGNNVEIYLNVLDGVYESTLRRGNLQFQGRRIALRRDPTGHAGRDFIFCHLTSSGNKDDSEEQRVLDFDRCERLAWISWVIREANDSDGINGPVKWFIDDRNDVVLWYEEECYAVILRRRNGYFLLATAFIAEGGRAGKYDSRWRKHWGL